MKICTQWILVFALVLVAGGAWGKTPAKKTAAKPETRKDAELWSASFSGDSPVAVFFDATSGALFVSVREKAGGRVDRVTVEGKLVKQGVAKSKGVPGPLRAYDGRLYWIAGDSVLSFNETDSVSAGRIPVELGAPADIALGRKAQVYLGLSNGTLYQLQDQVGTDLFKGLPITGLFLLEDTLHVLRGTRLQSINLGTDTDPVISARPFCDPACSGLERTSAGNWLTIQGTRAVEVGALRSRVLFTSTKELGRPAYVYRKDPKDDFYVLPFPSEGVVRAYRMPGALK